MTPDAFIRKWRDATLKERSAAQEHFIDLCRLLDEPTPAEADPTGQWFTFEYGATKAGGGNGWADIWRRARFGWEYKGKGKDLQAAFKQLQLYAPALEYPPLLIVCDIDSIVIHTAFTGTVPTVRVITLDDLRDPKARQVLKWAFTDPEQLRPGQTTAALTESAAGRFGDLALTLRGRGHDAWSVGHFCIRLLFCLFAEDIGLLPQRLFTRLLDAGQDDPADLETMLGELFGAMATGGRIGFETVDWFNGGLFDSRETLPLDRADIQTLRKLARLDWSAIEPSIFGTLFERGLDPDKRSQLGAHYTDRDAIMRIVDPVVLDHCGPNGPLARSVSKPPWPGSRRLVHRPPAPRSNAGRRRCWSISWPGWSGSGPWTRHAARAIFCCWRCSASRIWSIRSSSKPRRWACRRSTRWSGRRTCSASRSIPMPPSWRGSRSGSAKSSGCATTASR